MLSIDVVYGCLLLYSMLRHVGLGQTLLYDPFWDGKTLLSQSVLKVLLVLTRGYLA